MIPEEFKYNYKAKYQAGAAYGQKNTDIITQKIVVISSGRNFMVSFADIYENYVLPRVTSKDIYDKWQTNPMQFWQNQLKFAIWFATTGCGVDYNNQLSNQNEMTNALFKFHVYYQIRRILKEISAPLPQNQSWNALDNGYDKAAYEKICSEFNVSPSTDWRQKIRNNNGMGTLGYYIKENSIIPYTGYEWDPKKFVWGRKPYLSCLSTLLTKHLKI